MNNLIKLVHNFKKAKILVIGDLILDEFIWGKASRLSPEAPVPVVRAEEREYIPGGACNVSSNITSLGAKTTLLGVVGKDRRAEYLFAELKKRKIDTNAIVQDKNRRTILKTRVIAQRQQVVRVDWEQTGELSKDSTRKVAGFIKKNLNKFDAIIIEDYGKGVITENLLKYIRDVAAGKKIITVDPKEEHFSMYRDLGITAITPNRSEAENAIRDIKIRDAENKLHIYSDKLRTASDIDRAGKELLKYLNSKAVLITLGEQGMQLFAKDKAKSLNIPTVAREVFDVSGAGDTVIAVFTLALASGAKLLEAAHLANYAAGIVVGKIGTATVSPKELIERIR
ncbi:MAG: D-glycero-beta-D-manno-heptose-7-phosphate kinase [Candidatus Omnitrophica bacterium]|nr:D-glycero-beta-D-manno-heptose-7-phosphate kinase [Candidatus Omnitrophota bacterium]